MNDINLTTKFVGNIEGHFIVPAYQRGYRWDDEVVMMLDDIGNVNSSSRYCLQPIVVKKIDDDVYELIDGQQRLTTLFLLLGYIRTHTPKLPQNFTIDYKIRTQSREFLMGIDFDNIKDEAGNIDEYFINKAAKSVRDWFEKDGNSYQKALQMANKLFENVSVIWYEIDGAEDAIALFTRLNIGKIPLTNAELVRALFLSKNNGIDERYQLEISTQWDNMENELHNDRLWYFVTNRNAQLYPTRIELLFDLMSNKPEDDRERLRTFFWFNDRMRDFKDNKIELWQRVIATFQRIKEWYNNTELYHKIGYLVASKSVSLYDLMKKSSEMTKDKFVASLDEKIAKSIDFKLDYDELTYGYNSGEIEKLLLLFNVESARTNGDKSLRFPFEKHKQVRGGWSLEHIHAQQSIGLDSKPKWNEWLDLQIKSLKNINYDNNKELIEEVEKRDKERLKKEDFDRFFDSIIQAFKFEQNADYIDTLGNMALLGKFENSALNNSTFDVKRDRILEMDSQGDYIPICTRRVFLKYYTPSNSNQLHFWGQADREAYLAAMDAKLRPYLSIINREIK